MFTILWQDHGPFLFDNTYVDQQCIHAGAKRELFNVEFPMHYCNR